MNILIVDDEPAALRNLKNVLSHVVPHAVVEAAEDAEQAMRICRNKKMEIAFLDIEMPGEDGLTLAKKIREICPNINIIMVTAYSGYALEAFRVYASGYILKPAMEDEVREVLSNLRNPVQTGKGGLYVRCFGMFEVLMENRLCFPEQKQRSCSPI